MTSTESTSPNAASATSSRASTERGAPPDPCEVAATLREDGVELVINTVRFALGDDDAARNQLECIAEAGGGTFHDVADAAELSQQLVDVAQRERGRFETAGRTLEGAIIPRDANTGTVGTAHVDTILDEEANYYRFEIEPGSEVQAELILAPNADLANDIVRSCSASVALTDSTTDQIGDFDVQYGKTTDVVVAQTPPTVVDADEVYAKIEAGCSNYPEPDVSYDIEFKLTATN